MVSSAEAFRVGRFWVFFFFFFAGPFPTAGTARIPYQEEPVIGASDVGRITGCTNHSGRGPNNIDRILHGGSRLHRKVIRQRIRITKQEFSVATNYLLPSSTEAKVCKMMIYPGRNSLPTYRYPCLFSELLYISYLGSRRHCELDGKTEGALERVKMK